MSIFTIDFSEKELEILIRIYLLFFFSVTSVSRW